MDKENNNNLGFLDILCLILITLKLIGEISWGWGWVLLPWLGKYILGYGIIIISWIIEIWKKRNY